ncbi:hypothetical protein GWI34_18395 [Actinomadura sp. DSM 109109]|nr:hypothetical protein [Actinomadura lepetitiana]
MSRWHDPRRLRHGQGFRRLRAHLGDFGYPTPVGWPYSTAARSRPTSNSITTNVWEDFSPDVVHHADPGMRRLRPELGFAFEEPGDLRVADAQEDLRRHFAFHEATRGVARWPG